MDAKGIVIVGASSQGLVAREALRTCGLPVIGFVDDDPRKREQTVGDLRVLGNIADLAVMGRDVAAFVAIGNTKARIAVAHRLRSQNVLLVNAIHASAVIMDDVQIGTNVLCCAGSIVVVGSQVSDDVVVNTGATIDHESVLEQGVYLAPGVKTAGRVHVGRETFVGLGALLGPGVRIGAHSIIGAGSVVLADIPDRVFACGVPARVVSDARKEIDWAQLLGGASRQ